VRPPPAVRRRVSASSESCCRCRRRRWGRTVAQQHLRDLDRLKKLVKLTVLIATTEQFAEHASVAGGASDLFVEIFGSEPGHVRLVYGVQSLPVRAPLVVDTIFEIAP
jgi:enamine deaminase RidA (YjgF/YER057c/UK114 family)